MGIEDLPILKAGTRIDFEEYKDRIAEVVYTDNEEDARKYGIELRKYSVVGYIPGILNTHSYTDRTGMIHSDKRYVHPKRLLLIREVKLGKPEESVWDDTLCVEIPLKKISEYRELVKP